MGTVYSSDTIPQDAILDRKQRVKDFIYKYWWAALAVLIIIVGYIAYLTFEFVGSPMDSETSTNMTLLGSSEQPERDNIDNVDDDDDDTIDYESNESVQTTSQLGSDIDPSKSKDATAINVMTDNDTVSGIAGVVEASMPSAMSYTMLSPYAERL